LRGQLEPLVVDPKTDALMFARGLPYDASHRHFSHAMAIHPLGSLNIEGDESERRTVQATLRQLDQYGGKEWVGYSFSWRAAMAARAGDSTQALRYLSDFERAFILRNGFHANGDQSGKGLSGFTYRPFTLEGNMLAMHATQEMLLQSWGGVVRVFPATPTAWTDAEFKDLRAEGGYRISARRAAGRIVSVRLEATVDGTLRLRDNFGGAMRWNRDDAIKRGDNFEVVLKRGEALTGEAVAPAL